jgi:multiple sugar transport system substrate-binding protein
MQMRTLLKAVSPLVLALTIGVTTTLVSAPANAAEIRFSWWGGQLRNQKTDDILKLFESETPGVTVIREQSDWQPHWDKLKIQAAAGNQPCTIQMQTRWLSTYADPNILRPLDDLVDSGELDISGISEATIESSRGDDGNLYMIPTGVFYFAVMYNKSMLDDAGVAVPPDDWTWKGFADWLREVKKGLPEGVNATHNMGPENDSFVTWVQTQGYKVFDGTHLAFPEEVTADWFRFWETLRSEDLTDSPEEMLTDTGSLIEESNIANGRTFLTNRPPNRFDSHQKVLTAVTGQELAIHPYPRGEDGTTGMDLGANGIAIGAPCTDPDKLDASVKWINFFTQDPRAAAIYESDNGAVTVAALQDDQLNNPNTSDGQREFIKLYQRIADTAKSINYPPGGTGAMQDALTRAYEAVAFGQLTPDEAAAQFHADIEDVLN